MAEHDVTYQREEYARALPDWELVDDVVEGERAIKGRTVKYLPKPNPTDDSTENKKRYEQYLFRALFFNATGRTLQSLVGAAFRKVPTLEAPGVIDYCKADIDGAGISVYQQSQEVTRDVLKRGRHGLLVDYPQTSGESSRADMASGQIRATVASIGAKQIVNWRTAKMGAKHVLVLLVIHEMAEEVTEDGFGVESIEQYRVLRLDPVYTQEIWRKDANNDWVLWQAPFTVLNSSGQPWREIPFTFVGANNNDSAIDPSPMTDMAHINVGHYRNSADYEDSAYLVGQPQIWMAGLTEQWVQLLEEKGIYLGSRAPMLLPVDGSAGMLQAEPNTLCKEAMDQKEGQLLALGARLITPGSAVKTATEAQGETEAEHSVLSLAVSNVSEAYTKCLQWMLEFMGGNGTVEYAINQEFTKPNLDAQLLTALVQLWQTGKYPEADLFDQLRKYGLVDPEKDDDTIKDELEGQDGGLGLDDAGSP